MTHVVTGILVVHDRYLLQQRKADGSFPLCWETPGGKVEPGETAAAAIIREWREELTLDVQPTGQLNRVRLDHPSQGCPPFDFTAFFLDCKAFKDLCCKEACGVGFFTLEQAFALPATPGLRWLRHWLPVL